MELSYQIKRAIQYDIPLHDVFQGALMNTMVEMQDKVFPDKQWAEGYQDAIADMYSLCYDIVFYKKDVEAGNYGNV